MATQTSKGYPYPEDTDPADVPADVQALASAVDLNPGIASLTQTEINALSAGEKWAGRVVWNETTTTLQVSNGSTFSDLNTTTGLSDSPPSDTFITPSAGTAETASRSDHIHGSPGISSLTQTEINGLSSGDKWAGRVVWNETTTTLQVSNGSTFTDVDTSRALATSTPGDVVETGSVGVATNVARSDHVHGVSSSFITSGAWVKSTAPDLDNLTLGNGSAIERYARVGDIVHATLHLTWGSTTSLPTWAWLIWKPSLEIYYEALSGETKTPIGTAMAFNDSTNYDHPGICYTYRSYNYVYFRDSTSYSDEPWGNANPFGADWAEGDVLTASITYQCDPSE